MNEHTKFNNNEKITVYIPRQVLLKLYKIKDMIYTEYQIIMPISELFRDSIKHHVSKFDFKNEETLKQDIEQYMQIKELV